MGADAVCKGLSPPRSKQNRKQPRWYRYVDVHFNLGFPPMRLVTLSLAALLLIGLPATAQDRSAGLQTAFARVQHLKHGINASEWFAQSASDYSAARTNRYTMRATLR